MDLQGALSIATGGLANINTQLGLVSNNVANASTPDYSLETPNQESLVAGSQAMGVRTEAATRAIDLALQQAAFQQDTTVSGLTTTTTSLQTIDALQGSPGAGNDLGSLLGQVQSAFSTLLGDPSSAAQQSAVVSAAGNLTGAVNALSNGYTQQRQSAQNDIVSAVTSMNTDLSQIGSLSDQIITARVQGQSSADLENQRDQAVHALSLLVGIRTLAQPNGDLIVTTTSGTAAIDATRRQPGANQRRDDRRGRFVRGRHDPGDHGRRHRRHQPVARRPAGLRHRVARHHLADLSGRTRRVFRIRSPRGSTRRG